MRPSRSCRRFASKFHLFSCLRHNFHQGSLGGVTIGTIKAADNFLDGAGALEFGDKSL